MNPQDLQGLFNYQLAVQAIDNLISRYGWPGGTLFTLVVALFVASLVWVWVREKFDTWAFWILFLRLFLASAILTQWKTLFFTLDSACDSATTLFGFSQPAQEIANLLLNQFSNWDSITWNILSLLTGGILFEVLGLFLALIAFAMYGLNIVGAHFTTLLLYAVGPFFVALWVFDPLQDLMMRFVRFYLTIKVWLLLNNLLLYILDASLASNLSTLFGQEQGAALSDAYLLFLIVGLGACFPMARGLVGGAGNLLASGSMVPGVAAAAGGAALTVGGMAAGAAIAGPAGAGIGGGVGGAAGKAGGTAVNPPGRQ
jgi:hypothetical protein